MATASFHVPSVPRSLLLPGLDTHQVQEEDDLPTDPTPPGSHVSTCSSSAEKPFAFFIMLVRFLFDAIKPCLVVAVETSRYFFVPLLLVLVVCALFCAQTCAISRFVQHEHGIPYRCSMTDRHTRHYGGWLFVYIHSAVPAPKSCIKPQT